MTKQRKVYGAFLGLAALAFVGDRLFFLPAGAGAAVPPPLAEQLTESVPGDKPRAESTGPTLASRLEAVGATLDTEATRDPFRKGWIVPSDGPEADRRANDLVSPAGFAGSHELTAVLNPKSGEGMAVIARKSEKQTGRKDGPITVKIGQTVSGWRLVAVDASSATLEQDGARAVLELKQPVMGDNAGESKR